MTDNITTRPTLLNRLLTGWNLLAFCGFGYVPGGLLLVIWTWKPTSGPYVIGERYPYGGYLEAWQVSVGFAFLAFGLLFAVTSLVGSRTRSKWLWFALLTSFVLMWFPHLWMGILFIIEDPSLSILGDWTKSLPPILAWMLIAALGFYLSWRDLQKQLR